MRSLASYVMRGRSSAILVAATSSILALILPPLVYVSGAVVGLVALRHGPREGAFVAFGAIGAAGLLSFFLMGQALTGALQMAVISLPLLLVAQVWRRTISMAYAMETAGLIAATVLVGLYAFIPDPQAVWNELLMELLKQSGEVDPSVKDFLEAMAALMNAMVAVLLMMGMIFCMMLARWWQAMLYNPGGFQEEFHDLKLHSWMRWLVLGSVISAWAIGDANLLPRDFAALALVLMAFQGLAVAHALVRLTESSVGWLVALYLLILIGSIQMMVLLAVIGLADSRLDFRARYRTPGNPDDNE